MAMSDNQNERHEMVLSKVHDSGVEEWVCPTCGRRFLMQWPPEYRKVILENGDENAIHSGGKSAPAVELDENNNRETMRIGYNEPGLEPYLVWMDQVNFSNLWNQ